MLYYNLHLNIDVVSGLISLANQYNWNLFSSVKKTGYLLIWRFVVGTYLHMLDFLDIVVLGDDGGV